VALLLLIFRGPKKTLNSGQVSPDAKAARRAGVSQEGEADLLQGPRPLQMREKLEASRLS
jgi:hypothetical protein